MASSALIAMLLAVADIRPRHASPHEFCEWLDFAREHAPCLHPDQSDVSRIACSCIWWARERGVCFYHVAIRKTCRDAPVVVTAQQVKKINARAFLELACKRFRWMDDVCTLLFTLRRVHLGKDALVQKHGPAVKALDQLEESSVFDPGSAMDMMIDFDSFHDVVDVLQKFYGSGMGT